MGQPEMMLFPSLALPEDVAVQIPAFYPGGVKVFIQQVSGGLEAVPYILAEAICSFFQDSKGS